MCAAQGKCRYCDKFVTPADDKVWWREKIYHAVCFFGKLMPKKRLFKQMRMRFEAVYIMGLKSRIKGFDLTAKPTT